MYESLNSAAFFLDLEGYFNESSLMYTAARELQELQATEITLANVAATLNTIEAAPPQSVYTREELLAIFYPLFGVTR